MVWFTLYGEQGFNIIQDYFTKQFAESRKEIKSGKSTLVHAPKIITKSLVRKNYKVLVRCTVSIIKTIYKQKFKKC